MVVSSFASSFGARWTPVGGVHYVTFLGLLRGLVLPHCPLLEDPLWSGTVLDEGRGGGLIGRDIEVMFFPLH